MQTPPDLADRDALIRARDRARSMATPALFLQVATADEIEERLSEVNRDFTEPAVVTPFPEVWEGRLAGARIVADTETLDLAPGAHDLVVHALSLHWASDPVGQIVQCRRALRPDGLLLAAAFGGTTLQELRAVLAEAETRVTGGLSPRVAPMGEIRDLGALLQRAGLALPVADNATSQVRYRDLYHLMRDLRAMGETNVLAERHRKPVRRSVFETAAQLYAETYGDAEGRVPATFETVFLTGWAPHESQQTPLKPGSAAHRLAEALEVEEVPLPDRARPRGD